VQARFNPADRNAGTRRVVWLLVFVALGIAGSWSGRSAHAAAGVSPASPRPADSTRTVYRLYEAFYYRTNPNGVWSFGWKDAVASPFNLMTNWAHALTHEGAPLEGWSCRTVDGPIVLCNTNERPFYSRSAVPAPKNAVWVSCVNFERPMPGKYGVIRFTAPGGGGGRYQFLGGASSRYKETPNFGDADFHILHGGREASGRWVPRASGFTFTNAFTLTAGEFVDFVVGPGQDDRWNLSDLYVSITVTKTGP
jgi:hypothetical protein